MHHSPPAHDPKELERRRAEAYRQVPLLRQQALEDTARALAGLWRRWWGRAGGAPRAGSAGQSPEPLRGSATAATRQCATARL